jgi:hypothetical protein
MPKPRRILVWSLSLLAALFVLLCMPFNPRKWTANEIRVRVDLLNEKAAISTPHHDLGKDIRAQHLALFEKVEKGTPLSEAESSEYRVLYQSILKQKQHELALLDDQLTVLTNYQPQSPNNVGTLGIEGAHDHHDASSAANLAALRADLTKLETAHGITGSVTRIRAALETYKDLDDVILHMATAPQTKSVPRDPEATPDAISQHYEGLMLHFKRAQFEPVNSPAYVSEVHEALNHYDALVLIVQDRVHAQLGPLERSLAGRWGSYRTLAPSLRGVTTNRIGRTLAPPAAAR